MHKLTQEMTLEYPCAYPIKAQGYADADFAKEILTLVQEHAKDAYLDLIRYSKNNKFQSVTIVIQAQSQEQVMCIVNALKACDKVLSAL